MTLTAAQLAKRGEIGASDVPVMVCGDDHSLLTKWREMCGLQEREDFTNVWRVQFGNHVEPFGLGDRELPGVGIREIGRLIGRFGVQTGDRRAPADLGHGEPAGVDHSGRAAVFQHESQVSGSEAIRQRYGHGS